MKKIRILCIGNSILHHPAAPQLGWYDNWGMAASSEDKDYFHIMQKLVSDEFPMYDAEFFKAGGFPIESGVTITTDYDYTSVVDACIGNIMKENKIDIITFQIGDNVKSCTEDSYAYMLESFVDYCRGYNPSVAVILTANFHGSRFDKKTLR